MLRSSKQLQKALLAASLCLATVFFLGCASDEFTGSGGENRPPEVWLTIAPPEGSTVEYSVHMYWGGFDPDGNISHFEFAITDNETGIFDPADTTGAENWCRTNAKDSVFEFTADVIADSSSIDPDVMQPYEFRRSHTFFVRAVDDMGARSRVKYRSFTARNISPVVNITSPRTFRWSAIPIPPQMRIEWEGWDLIEQTGQIIEPESVRTILVNMAGRKQRGTLDYVRTTPDAPEWSEWLDFDAPGDSGRSWSPEAPLEPGGYLFAVQGKDVAGAVTPVFDIERNVRFLNVLSSGIGPQLTVSNRYTGEIVTTGTKSSATVLNLPAGIEVKFTFSADASRYGGTIVGYRFGWDVLDLSDDSEWEIGWTPFVTAQAKTVPRFFYFGTHTLHIEVMDNSGYISRLPIVFNVIPFSMERPLLLIDDWEEGSTGSFVRTNGAIPSDREQDAFWEEVLADVPDFAPQTDTWPPYGRPVRLPITVLAQYRTVIWNVRATPLSDTVSLFERLVRFGSSELNIVSLYLQAGGRLLICGDYPMTGAIKKGLFPTTRWNRVPGPNYPFIYRYELGGNQDGIYAGQDVGVRGVGEQSFAYDDCCLNVVDITHGIGAGKWRDACPTLGVREYHPRKNGIRNAVPVDGRLPLLELRPEVSGPGRFYEESLVGLQSDIYNPAYFGPICDFAEFEPPRKCFEPMYVLHCLDLSSPILGAPIGYWFGTYADVENLFGDTGRSAVWGFSPVYLNPAQVREALNVILFDEWNLPR